MSKTICIEIVLLNFLLGVGVYTIYPNQKVIVVCIFVLFFSLLARYIFKIENLYFISIILITMGLLIGFSRIVLFQNNIDSNDVDFFVDMKNFQKVEGEIVKEPTFKDENITYILGNLKIEDNPKEGCLLVKLDRSYEFQFGDILELEGKITLPENSDDFKYKEYLLMKGVRVILKNPKVLSSSSYDNGFYILIFQLKAYVENQVKNILQEPHASFLNGLLFGSKAGMPEDVLNDFKITGLSHIIAISGYNITIIIIIVLACLGFLPRKIQLIFAAIFIILFTIFVGAEASVVRASFMGILSLMALYYGKSQNVTHILIIVASIMIFMNYRVLIYDVGFQLSFMATAGLVYISPMIEKYFSWLPDFFSIRESFLLTISAQITALPIILYHFGNLSLVSPFANVLVSPFLPIAMLFGFLAFIVSILSTKIGILVAVFAYLPLDIVLKTAYYLSRVNFASVDVPKFSIFFLLAYYFMIYIFFRRSLKKV